MRERLIFQPLFRSSLRITPARAGKTLGNPGAAYPYWDHPRSCGKDSASPSVDIWRTGSPPLVRERLPALFPAIWLVRITPARAGKTRYRIGIPGCFWDHPRSCGKDATAGSPWASLRGSPPLVRERLADSQKINNYTRITPARAGKTKMVFSYLSEAGDHPRSCGKDRSSAVPKSVKSGSPPLVRERQ